MPACTSSLGKGATPSSESPHLLFCGELIKGLLHLDQIVDPETIDAG